MKKKPSPKLEGEDATPIVRPNPLVVGLVAHRLPVRRQNAVYRAAHLWPYSEQLRKIVIIAQQYGIPPTSDFWRLLAVALCEEVHPGTRIVDATPRGPGAPKKNWWPLWMGVDGLIRDGHSVASACRHLSRQDGPWKGKKATTLETRYYEEDARVQKRRDAPPDPLIENLWQIARGEIELPDHDDGNGDKPALGLYGNYRH